MKLKKDQIEEPKLRATAAVFTDLLTHGGKKRDYREHMIAAYIYTQGRPVTVYEVAKKPYAGSYRTAKRVTDGLIRKGVIEETEGGIRLTNRGETLARLFFTRLYQLRSDVDSMFKALD